MQTSIRNIVVTTIALALYGCYGVRPSQGGGEVEDPVRKTDASDIAVPTGYQVKVLASGLTFPTGIAFDESGQIYFVESGYSYGETWTKPRLLKLTASNNTEVIATGDKNGPWNGVTFHDGSFFVAEGGALNGGKILRIDRSGNTKTLIDNLPSKGDHHTNGPVILNGYVYFGLGTATNAGVVGEDNADFGWLKRQPDFHDIPCKDIVLNGKNYESKNQLTEDPDDKTMTGAFVAYGTTTTNGEIIRGKVPCSGAIMRIPVAGGEAELLAWGFRNPFGLAVHDGKIFAADNGYDERGSRPVWGTGDILWQVNENKWYGWPDYSGVDSLNSNLFNVPGKGAVDLVLKEIPNDPPKPAAVLGVHSSSNGIDFSTSDDFGFKGMAFVAQLGDMAPNVGKVLAPVGFKVVTVDVENGIVKDFAVNKGKRNGPASRLKNGGFERPVDVKFSPDGNALYVVDFGVIEMSDGKTTAHKGTGVIWKITKQ